MVQEPHLFESKKKHISDQVTEQEVKIWFKNHIYLKVKKTYLWSGDGAAGQNMVPEPDYLKVKKHISDQVTEQQVKIWF